MSLHPEFADIILPLAISGPYTYRVPEKMSGMLQPGIRVIVPLGKRKLYTGIILRLHDEDTSAGKELKEISDIIDSGAVVNEFQLKFWEWMASYYMCSPGEILKAALPGGMKLESESSFVVNESWLQTDDLNDKQKTVFNFLRKLNSAGINDIVSATGIRNPQLILDQLLNKNAVFLEEKLREDYKPRMEVYLRLSEKGKELLDSDGWESLLNRSPKQRELLKIIFETTIQNGEPLKQNLLYGEFSLNIINTLFRKEYIEKYEVENPRLYERKGKTRELYPLSKAQESCYRDIRKGFGENKVQLLHGVTSSGKTEIYIHLIKEFLDQGKQVLYLLPEIALTSQIVGRIEEVFPDDIAVYHSRFNDAERVDVYRNLVKTGKGERKLVLGARSAVFLPFSDLGLVIVDEEHETSYKQHDPSPRYHARDSAIVLAGLYRAKVLLGTATPSVESYLNCKSGKYGLVELNERFGGINLPEIRVTDLRKARLKREMRSVFSPTLITEMERVLAKGKQLILFQNRRGYSSFLECESCGWIPKCKSCDVSLTYHKYGNNLRCHYCGYTISIPGQCTDCGSSRLVTRGFGTELVEDDLELIFPGVKVARLDLDTTRSRKAYERILSSFAAGTTRILVGTQMLSKGLDFENVELVGILNADQMLNYPDFRAFERSFQLMSQVSGRAGRKHEQGMVVIQTSDPGHPVIRYVLNNDFQSFYKDQVFERQEFRYPPFYRLIKLTLKSKELNEGRDAADFLGTELRKVFGKRVLGPHPPVIGRVKTWYLQQIIIKIERKASFSKARNLLSEVLSGNEDSSILKKVRINIDVDPL